MDAAEYTILALNAALGFGFAWPLAGLFSRLTGKPRRLRLYALLVVAYVLECAAFSASMGTDVLSIVLAFLWGGILGSWLRRHRPVVPQARRAVVLFASYSGLPAASFLTVPVMAALGGWSVLTGEDGHRFGIPAFVPWPLNTIVGFCVAVASVAVVSKLVITISIVRMMTNPDNAGRATTPHGASSRVT
jgi:hypothetical protein